MAEIEKISEIVRKLSALLDETGLTEIEYGDEGWHVRVSKSVGVALPAAAPVETASAAPA